MRNCRSLNNVDLQFNLRRCRAEDLIGKRVGTWKIGDQFDVGHWLKSHGLGLHDVELIQQRPAAQDLLSGEVDCATAMSYNEFQTVLNAGKLETSLFTVFRPGKQRFSRRWPVCAGQGSKRRQQTRPTRDVFGVPG